MNNEEARKLLIRYDLGQCTEHEKALLESWLLQYNEHDLDLSEDRIREIGKQIYAKLPEAKKQKKMLGLWTVISSAAALVVIGIVLFLFARQQQTHLSAINPESVKPGGNRATITLANGKRIMLSPTKKRVIVLASGLTYDDGSEIVLDKTNGMQTITTPRGGEYQILLSDGSKVWLNAATTLEYPAIFRKRFARNIRLVSGEAYFEIAKDRSRPFTVTTVNQKVTVLGTKFDISAYTKSVTTTLLEGSVRLSLEHSLSKPSSALLTPGEQASEIEDNLQKIVVDTTLVVAWKNGRMKFHDANLKSILDEAERWYDIQVRYEGKIPDLHLTGGISRKSNLSTLLKLLKLSGIDFHLSKKSGREILFISSPANN